MSLIRPTRPLAIVLAATITLPALAADDTPAIDPAQLQLIFKQAKDAQAQQSKSVRQRAYQEAVAAAQNPSRGAELWEQAVQATRFEGAAREGTGFRDWKDKEGAALRDKEIQSALRLHFNWLALTLQKLNGATNKELLPVVIQHTKEATAHQLMMETFEEGVKRAKELAASGKHGLRDKAQKNDDDSIRQLNRQLVGEGVSSSVVARWMKLDESINDLAPRGTRQQPESRGSWVQSAGDVDGIFESIILPELREQKDPRLLEYWDVRLKRAGETIAKSRLTFDIDRFNTITRPKLLWSRAQDVKLIGHRNRALSEMVTLIKTYPTHPDAAAWIAAVEQELTPQTPAAPVDSAATGSAAPAAAAAPVGVPAAPRTP